MVVGSIKANSDTTSESKHSLSHEEDAARAVGCNIGGVQGERPGFALVSSEASTE